MSNAQPLPPNIMPLRPGIVRPRLERRVALHHLAFFRATLEGIDLAEAGERYLETGKNVPRARHTLKWIKLELIAACRLAKPHYARILKVPPERYAKDGAEASSYRDLEDFRLQVDPSGFYTEAELIEQFEQRYQDSDPKARRRAQRNARLRRKLKETLAWLETYLPVEPQADDPVGVWLDEDLASNLNKAGIETVAQLGSLMARRGARWHRAVRGIGPETAPRIERWLANAGLKPEPVRRPTRDSPPAPTTAIVPFERFIPPSSLTGSNGSNRSHASALAARNDLEAIAAWLDTLGDEPNTVRSYRAHAERFLLWMIFEKGKPLSSATNEDCSEYRNFLAAVGQEGMLDEDGQRQFWYWTIPSSDWVGQRKEPRFSPAWRPFAGPLSASSQKLSVTIVVALFEWLTRQRYLVTNPWDKVAKAKADNRLRVDHALSAAQWQATLSACADIADTLPRLRMRFLLLAAYSLGLRLSELRAMKVAQRVEEKGKPNYGLKLEPTGDGWEIMVKGKGSKNREVPVPTKTLEALCDYMAARGFGDDPGTWPEGVILVASLSGSAYEPLSASRIYRMFEAQFAKAAKNAPTRADGNRLQEASTHWLRHTHATHALAAGVSIDVVADSMGHASEATTRLYTHANRRRRRAGAEKLMSFTGDNGHK